MSNTIDKNGVQKLKNIIDKNTANSDDYEISYLNILNPTNNIQQNKNSKFSLSKFFKTFPDNNQNNMIEVDGEVLIKEKYNSSIRNKYLKKNSFKLSNLAKLL